MSTLGHSLRLLLLFTLLTGGLYPLAVWTVGQLFFPAAAEGSLVTRDGRLIGSSLLAQANADPRYFWPRPSAGGYATVASGASNQAWTNTRLYADVAARRGNQETTSDVPADLLTASGSGLDPEISLAAARWQAPRIAAARKLTAAQRDVLDDLIAQHAAGGQFSPLRVNVLLLNLALDSHFSRL